ncbi:MAG: SDR family NAD(P)-dependent oxidoreductase [Spirochaetales bacterium]
MIKDPNRIALVTGATGVIGAAIVQGLAKKGDIRVIPSGRNPEKVFKMYPDSLGLIRKGTLLDQGSKESIHGLADGWKEPLHILIINASATPPKRTETNEGIETQWAVNVLGYHRLIKTFHPLLFRSAKEIGTPSRIVVVASSWAGDIDLADPEFKRRRYENGTAYRQSKQAERMLSFLWSTRLLKEYGHFSTGAYTGCPYVTVNACHPGEVNTPLSNSLGFGGHETPEEGADTPVWVATAKELASITGAWFTYRNKSNCRFCSQEKELEHFWNLIESYS